MSRRRANPIGPIRIARLFSVLVLFPAGPVVEAGAQPSSRHPGQPARIELTVAADGFERLDLPVEVPIDLGALSGVENAPEPPNPEAIRVVEVDDSGRTIDAQVSCQFDPSPDSKGTAGTLVLLLNGSTAPDASRRYVISLDDGEDAASPISPTTLVTLNEGLEFEGQESLRISTPSATLFYHTLGAGFARLEDRDGLDWLGYRPGGGSAGEYRGIPNLVHPQGYFHPGGTECTSRVVSRGPLRVRIASEAEGGRWSCFWDIFPGFARLTVDRAAQPYWFLYEGTPGGSLEPDGDYYVLPDGRRRPASERWSEDIPGPEWLYFGDRSLGRVLVLAHLEDDEEVDAYYPMEGNMTVFGFGRLRLEKYLDRTPAHFIVALVEENEHDAVERAVEGMIHPVEVEIIPVEADGGARR